MKQRCGFLVLLLATAMAAHGEEGAFPKTDQVGEELKKLDQLPVVVEYRDMSKKLHEFQEEQQKQNQEFYDKLQKLSQTEAYREYTRKRQELESQRVNTWEVERKAMAEAARVIYAARHEEIKSVAKAEWPEAKKLGFDVLTYPRVDGSTSTGPLSVMMACHVLDVPYAWIYPEPTGRPWSSHPDVAGIFLPASGRDYNPRDYEFLLATLKVVAKPARKEQERIAIMINSLLTTSSTTHNAYVKLVEGKCDLNLTARPPSESELKLAKEKGVSIKLEPIARDAFVFIVNQKNPVKSLTRQQVREIYEEKITEWKAVGGGEGKIRAFRRERDSGSRELFDALVTSGQALPEGERYNPLYSDSMSGPYNQVTQQADGLGYSIYYYEHFMAASPFTRTVAIDGVEPTAATIASGEYPWVTRVYAAYRDGEAEDSPGIKLLRWLTSAEGQAIVRESGYVPEK